MKSFLDRAYYTHGLELLDPAKYGGPVDGFEAWVSGNPGSHYNAMVFFGKQSKPIWHYLFKTEEAMIEKIKSAADSRKASVNYKAKVKAEKAAFVPSVKVGDIFGTSWGYNQTNREFYQVIEIPSPKTVILREVAQDIKEEGFMAGYTKPIKNNFIGEAFSKRVGQGNSISFASYRHGRLLSDAELTGKGLYVSWYA